MAFFRLIRLPNLLMIALTQLFIRFFFFEKFEVALALNNFQFVLLILATVFIAAAGNIINDIYDLETDLVNKPQKVVINKEISEKKALKVYILLNFLAVFIGFYLSHSIGRPGFAILFIIFSAMLYLYASNLKGSFFLGNLLVGFLTAMVFIIVGIYDLLPNMPFFNFENRKAFNILFHFSIYAFAINLLREMVKDQQDINGDYKAGLKTLPIVLGRKRASTVILAFTIASIAGTVYYMYNFLYQNSYAVLFCLFLVLAPLLFFLVKLTGAKRPKSFKKLSLLLKLVMLIGILALALYPASFS